MSELLQVIAAMGIVATFSATAGLISIKIAEHIIEESEKEEEDYIYMNDGTPVKFNEEDQE